MDDWSAKPWVRAPWGPNRLVGQRWSLANSLRGKLVGVALAGICNHGTYFKLEMPQSEQNISTHLPAFNDPDELNEVLLPDGLIVHQMPGGRDSHIKPSPQIEDT